MSDTSFVDEIENKQRHKFKVYVVGVLVVLVLLGAAVSAMLSTSSKNASQVQSATESQDSYKYSYLGKDCEKGLASYRLHLDAINNESKNISGRKDREIAEIKSIEVANVAEAQRSYDYNTDQYNAAVADGEFELSQRIFTVMMRFNQMMVDAQDKSRLQQQEVLQKAIDELEGRSVAT